MWHHQMPPGAADGKLPVFVFPSFLTFYTDDQSSHKQVLTLYNPYDFPLSFKVLCTAPKKYSVVESEGHVKSRCCVDIVIRHKDVVARSEGVRDKVRMQITEYQSKTVIGKRDLVSVLLPTREKQPSGEEMFESVPVSPSLQPPQSPQHQFTSSGRIGGPATGPSWVVVTAALLCIGALMLPTSGDGESHLPSYLYLTLHQKLIAAYILGMVTMAILKS